MILTHAIVCNVQKDGQFTDGTRVFSTRHSPSGVETELQAVSQAQHGLFVRPASCILVKEKQRKSVKAQQDDLEGSGRTALVNYHG